VDGSAGDIHAVVSWRESWIADICIGCGTKHLQLNANKTELLCFGPASQLSAAILPSQSSTVYVNWCTIKPVTMV